MKVCILSMQRVANFGSLLQSYSLKKTVESLGHEVSFIDIERRDLDDVLLNGSRQKFAEEHEARGSVISKLKKIDKYAINRLHIKKRAKMQSRCFEKFRTNELGIDNESNDRKYDVCIIGSDEVFNCLADTPWGFTSQLFGDVHQADKVITYAASCGATTYDILPEPARDRIKQAFENVSAFSVRDENTVNFVKCMTDKQISVNYDPVIMKNFDEEMAKCSLPKQLKNYCIVYSYYNRIHDEKEIKAIVKFCKKHKLELVSVGAPQMWIRNHLVLNPFETLLAFKQADFVITDTFHGTIFSAKYSKRFATITRASNKNKLLDLISRLGVEQHLIDDMEHLEKAYLCNDFVDRIKGIQEEARTSAIEYLKKNI